MTVLPQLSMSNLTSEAANHGMPTETLAALTLDVHEPKLKSDILVGRNRQRPRERKTKERRPRDVELFSGEKQSRTQEERDQEFAARVDAADLSAGPDVGRKKDTLTVIAGQAATVAYASSISYVAQVLDRHLNPLFEGDHVRVTFDEEHPIPCIVIVMVTLNKRHRNVTESQSVLRFPAAAVEHMGILKHQHDEYMRRHDHNQCYCVYLKHNREYVSSENVFVPRPPKGVQPLARYMKTEDCLSVHICGSDLVEQNFNSMAEQFQQDRVINPLNAYIKDGDTRFRIHENALTPSDARPDIPNGKAKCSFINYDEFLVTNTIGPSEQQESLRQAVDRWEGEHDVWFFQMLGAGDRAYVALLQRSPGEGLRLSPGDVVVMEKSGSLPEEADPDPVDLESSGGSSDVSGDEVHVSFDWGADGRVSDPIPGLPDTLTALVMTRRWDQELGKHVGFENLESIPVADQDDLINNSRALRKIRPTKVKVTVPVNDRSYSNQLAGIAKFAETCEGTDPEAADKKRLVTGNEVTAIGKYDIFSDLATSLDPEHLMKPLNQGQMEAVALARAAPAGVVNIHGPPGTGKTHVMGEIARPFITANEPGSHVLAVSASNPSTDALAVRLQQIVRETTIEEQYVVRVHAVSTEDDVVLRNARKARGLPDDASPPVIDRELSEADQELFDSVRFAAKVHETYVRANTHFLDLVSDGRVTEASYMLSLGTRVLQLLGLIPAYPGDPQPVESFFDLRTMYRQYASSLEFDEDEMSTFRGRLADARGHILANAVVVVTTPALAMVNQVHRPFSHLVRVTMVDEASRLSEPDVIALMGTFPASRFVLAGDPMQLKPTVLDTQARFANQMGMSFQCRLMGNGTPSVLLFEQYRMSPKISLPLNNFAYQGRLADHETTTFEHRPQLAELQVFTQELLKVSVYSLLIDVRNTETLVAPQTRSRYNSEMAQFCYNTATKYADRFPDLRVAIICFYNAQWLTYLAMHDQIRVPGPSRPHDKFRVVKADMAQGLEFDVVIVDFTVGPNAGFLAETNRLVVAVSRARLFSALVVDKAHVVKARGSTNLKRICQEYLQLGRSVKILSGQVLRR